MPKAGMTHPLHYLEGLQPPASVDEVLAHAEENGAPEAVLRYLESLPAAVFTSEEGMRRALETVPREQVLAADPDAPLMGQDGVSS